MVSVLVCCKHVLSVSPTRLSSGLAADIKDFSSDGCLTIRKRRRNVKMTDEIKAETSISTYRKIHGS